MRDVADTKARHAATVLHNNWMNNRVSSLLTWEYSHNPHTHYCTTIMSYLYISIPAAMKPSLVISGHGFFNVHIMVSMRAVGSKA